ncbi:hypothetical protein L3X38_015367 [Prunus dulcis]|uniref:Uncharacterized protein n=1 Tax=Prunus dulcis TaxID=3755 RepID=A0AAD4WQI5_PRUDU|nr:hypothetical protein L3X38_015367 [Prunus dulcis]
MKKLNRTKEDLIPCGMAMSGFVSDKSKTIGVLPLKITMDDQTRTHNQKRRGSGHGRSDELLLAYWAEDSLMPNLVISLIKFQHKSDGDDVLTIDDLDPAPTEMEDSHPEV